MDPRAIPSFSTELWSEEVGRAEASEPVQALVGYRFSNGRTFAPPQYDAPVPPVITTLP